MIPSISITVDEGSGTFILARHKEVVQFALALSHVFVSVSQTVSQQRGDTLTQKYNVVVD